LYAKNDITSQIGGFIENQSNVIDQKQMRNGVVLPPVHEISGKQEALHQ
jgi:hypothetical protein